MTATEIAALATEIREEVRSLERSVADMADARAAAGDAPSRVTLWACGGTLHAFYTGIEKILEVIAAATNGTPTAGPAWRRRLLKRLSTDAPGVRPAVLAPQTAALLDDYLAFRHRYRNLYLFDLRWEPIRDLLDRAPTVWPLVSRDLPAFADALECIVIGEG